MFFVCSIQPENRDSFVGRVQVRVAAQLWHRFQQGKAWKLIWQDEFDDPKLDETKWNRLATRNGAMATG